MGSSENVSPEQIEAILRESHALSAALARGRTIRLVLFVLVIGFVAVVAGAFTLKFMKMVSEENLLALRDAAMVRLEKDQERYNREVQLLVEQTGPVLREQIEA